ncbi:MULTISPECIES: UPF0182 family membrane protein [unclassified Nocardioides]|uniref:UPF0182 family membrane protein n=1 Tax=unclassified Nocardioides TaxID=2615069 RepID=UPI0006F888C5|nr:MULTISPECIES: UPF0182 family protein [unclassified Nocardioides]KRA37968.1 hypothetical protein ASD81_04605 [Nocardioides sp. Root614]KRA91928.1 hypothetical protein ASD84_04870 [Nocardioides sp. Root682]
MSDLFDEEPDRPAPERPGRRARALVITGVILVVGFFLLTAFASIYTDRLWYREVGYGQVFSTMLWTRVGLFLVFGALMAAVVALNMHLAYRFRPLFRMSGGDASVERYRDAVTPIRGWLLAGVALVVGIFAGTSALGQWRTFLLWRNAESFGQKDTYFKKDIGFYVFELPWWNFVIDFAMAIAVVALIATAVVHYLYGGIRLNQQHDRLSGAAQVQFSVLLGSFVLAKSVDYFYDRYDLVTDDHRLFTGMNFTAENAVLPSRNILVAVALICAVLFFLNIWRRTWQLPSVGLALLALSAVLLGMIWPAIVQNFQVKPSEADKENSYIQANIDATRDAYGLSGVDTQAFQGIPDNATARKNGVEVLKELTDTPVVDPLQVRETFQQRQQVRSYYSVPQVLDVDRYQIDGEEVPLVLGVRELDQSGINASDQNWSNLHTVYTHGEGLIAAYANRIAPTDEVNGRIVWAEGIGSGASGRTDLTQAEKFETRVYFGEQSPAYSIVGKASGKADSVELGLADTGNDPEIQRTTYDGKGGVKVGSTFNQLMYAIKFGEPNFLLSGRVNANSKVLYNREPVERVEKVAPWLTVDTDPYPAVVNGRIQWIIDGYTTTDKYPNAQRDSFDSMIDDSLQQETGLQTLPTDEINYMRSAVKATVDAYDGTVKLYQWDEKDPILKTWMKVFPDSVTPRSEISDELMAHLRYPEDLFKVQRYQLARYHVTDAGEFYSGNNRWEVPEDPNAARQVFQPPYRLFTSGAADSADSDWSLTSVFVPYRKGTLASYLEVSSDATKDGFGELRLLEMTDQNSPGPGQVVNEMKQDPAVVNELRNLNSQRDTPPRYGNLLTLPVDGGLIYIEPVYVVRTAGASSFPILQYVIVKYGENVGIADTLPKALGNALGVNLETGEPDPGATPEPGETPEPTGSLDDQIAQALRDADTAFEAASKAQAANNTAEWVKQLGIAQDKVAEAVKLADERDKQAAKP